MGSTLRRNRTFVQRDCAPHNRRSDVPERPARIGCLQGLNEPFGCGLNSLDLAGQCFAVGGELHRRVVVDALVFDQHRQ